MSNHDSFLKILGLDEAEKPSNTTQEPAGDSAWEVAAEVQAEPSNTQSQSETEWDVGASDSLSTLDVAATEEPIESVENAQTRIEPQERSGWSSVSASEVGELNAEFQERVTRTETFHQTHIETAELTTNREKTAAYTPEEADQAEIEPIRGLTLTGTEKSKGTVPFDYEKSRTSRLSGVDAPDRTAHFDYSKQQGDHRIVVLAGRVSAQAFHLGQLPLRIGRDPQNEVILDDANTSRFHAEIRDGGGVLVVVDLGSTNGVKVNGALVTEQALKCHDIIQVGDCLFEFLDAGVLSKGAPLNAVVQEGSSKVLRPARKKKKFLWVAVTGGILVSAAALLFQSPQVQEAAKQQVVQAVLDRSLSEIEALKSMMETTYQTTIEKIDAVEVKKAFLERFQAKGLFDLAPGAREQIEKLPPPLIHLFVMQPDVYAAAVQSGGSEKAFAAILTTKLNDLIDAKNFPQALRIAEILLALGGENPKVRDAYEKIKMIVGRSSPQAADGASVTELEREFYGFMEEHENKVIRLVDEGKLEDAVRFSDIVTENIKKLGEDDVRYQRVTQEEVSRWSERREKLADKLATQQSKQLKIRATQAEGDELFERIQDAFDSNQLGEAKKLVTKFNEDFVGHDRFDEVQELSRQMDQMVEKSFEATQNSIKVLMEQESFESAWKELYRFKELMPPYTPADKLKAELTKVAGTKAAQFYNQARVFEFEADDLIAAEQYYKRTLEFADPESDLFQKAKRRFEDVKRKGVR